MVLRADAGAACGREAVLPAQGPPGCSRGGHGPLRHTPPAAALPLKAPKLSGARRAPNNAKQQRGGGGLNRISPVACSSLEAPGRESGETRGSRGNGPSPL